jgi:energy-coupling factor transporter ATP-binding protein EcfA2
MPEVDPMTNQIPTPARPYGERPWPRHTPAFTLLVCLLALIGGALVFAWQYKTRWTPLERYYFQDYFRTAHLATPRNPYFRPARTWEVLVIRYSRRERFAVDSEVEPVILSALTGRKAAAFRLTPLAVVNGARGLQFEPLRLDDNRFHAWLAQWIYSGRSLWQLFRTPWYAGLLILAIGLPFAIRKDRAQARKRREGLPLKGANVVSRSHYHRACRWFTGMGWLTAGRASLWEWLYLPKAERRIVRIARRHEREHILLVGDTGSGKSSLIRQILRQVRDRKETAIVYDPAREYLPEFYDPDRGDVILNPLDARMPYWSPSDEIPHHAEAETLAKSLYPDRDREYRFFVESPRKLFAHLLMYRPTPEELCQWIAEADPEIDIRVARTPLEEFIAKRAPQQRSGVLSGLERVSNAFGLLPPETSNGRRWTATEWAQERKGWLFLTSTPETRERLRPLLSLWLDFLVLRLTAQTGYAQRPVWVILDELASLDVLPTLPLALAESRKSNTRLVIGFQGRSQVEARYGQEAEAMLSQPRTRIFLRTGEPRAAEWVSKCIGESETEHVREGRSQNDWSVRSSTNATLDRRTEMAILASEIENLEDLAGYFQTPGCTLKLSFTFLQPESLHQPLIWRDVSEPGAVEAKSAAKARGRWVRVADPPGPIIVDGPPAEEVYSRPAPKSSQETGDTHPVTTGAPDASHV